METASRVSGSLAPDATSAMQRLVHGIMLNLNPAAARLGRNYARGDLYDQFAAGPSWAFGNRGDRAWRRSARRRPVWWTASGRRSGGGAVAVAAVPAVAAPRDV